MLLPSILSMTWMSCTSSSPRGRGLVASSAASLAASSNCDRHTHTLSLPLRQCHTLSHPHATHCHCHLGNVTHCHTHMLHTVTTTEAMSHTVTPTCYTLSLPQLLNVSTYSVVSCSQTPSCLHSRKVEDT